MALLPDPIAPMAQQDLLDLLDRLLPEHYLGPLKNPGPGYELLQAYARIFARVSTASSRLGSDSQFATATGGAFATGTVVLSRAQPNTSFNTPVSGQEGVSASIDASPYPDMAEVTGLTGMRQASVGRWLIIQAANSPENNGSFQIAAVDNATTVHVFNPAAVVPDVNNGNIVWQEVSRDVTVKAGTIVRSSAGGQTFSTTNDVLFLASSLAGGQVVTGQQGTAASTAGGAAAGNLRITGLAGVTNDAVGRFLTLQHAGAQGNIGRFQIVVWNSSTSVDIANPAGEQPDINNGAIVWQIEESFVGVRATSIGYEWNVPGQVIAADGEVLPGEIDTMDILVEDPPLGDPTITVVQIIDTTGGRDAALDSLGADRGITRLSGENDDAYRARARQLPDTISPDAQQRLIQIVLGPIHATFDYIETWSTLYQTCYDAPPDPIPGTLYNPNLFVYDDPDLDAYPFRNRWMDESDYRGGVIVVVENVQPLRDVGMVYDDTASTIMDLVSSETGGVRSPCAYDVPSNFGFGVPQGSYDGFDPDRDALYKGLYDALQSAKAGGTSVTVELRGQ